jgi:chaperonin GroEL (HSP60 family)
MTEKNTLVFRRFDDVHVRLLLCLQSEISQLEKELPTLESSISQGNSAEKMAQTMRVLRELRRVVAEYGKHVVSPGA